MTKKIKWKVKERKLLSDLLRIQDNDLNELIKKNNLNINIGEPPFNSDEKLLIAIGLMTDLSYNKIKRKLKDLNIR